MKTGNGMIDGDDGSHPSSPDYGMSVTCPSCRRNVNYGRDFCVCGMEFEYDEEPEEDEEE